MEKNTVWAIVLSSIVLVVFMILQPIIFPKSTVVPSANETVTAAPEVVTENTVVSSEETSESAVGEVDDLEDEYYIEENFTITTNKARVTFTNRGGDIVSYELIEHEDGEANIEMAENNDNNANQ